MGCPGQFSNISLHKIQSNSVITSLHRPNNLSLQMSAVLTQEYNVMVNSEELIGTTEYLTLYTRCCIN